MYANQTDIQKILGGVQQYLVPLFQRPYSWENRQWAKLWTDLLELCEEQSPRNHFIGSIVTMPARSVPEGVSKFVLIDGQQRLTTMLILLAAIRDKARRDSDLRLADKIDDLMLKNRHQDDTDIYKLLPTQTDRSAFCAIMDGTQPTTADQINNAYTFFERKLRSITSSLLDRLYTVICKHLVLVSIVLDRDDNPYLIFESLNATGQPLTQADLIRNFVFMRIHFKEQEKVFRKNWQPMQELLGQNLTDFMRHFLMRDGREVKQGDIYFHFKECVEKQSNEGVQDYLAEVAKFSIYYSRILEPSREHNSELAERFTRLNRFEATTAYPFLLNGYHDYTNGRLHETDFLSILDLLESFLIRRYVCGIPTNSLRKIFITLYSQATASGSLLAGVQRVLSEKNFPRDKQFSEQLLTLPLYGKNDQRNKAKLILDRLEAPFKHKEAIDTNSLTIEHIMPQTLTEWWKNHLGVDWEIVHDTWLNTIGNLTLTGYNPELSNADFPKKKAILNVSHIELNRYFANIDVWNADAIAQRGRALVELAIRVWPDVPRSTANQEDPADLDEEKEEFTAILDIVIEEMGGSTAQLGSGRFRIHQLPDGRVINVKYSRSHGKYYWFGIHSSLWSDLLRARATHVVLVLGTTGYASVPFDIINQYLAEAGTTSKADGSIRHYHLLVTTGSKPELFYHGNPTRFSIAPYFQALPEPE